MTEPGAERPDPRPAPATFVAVLRAHWLMRLAGRAMAFGVTPLLVYEAYHWITGEPSPRTVDLGALAFVGLGLGVLLILAGLVVAIVERWRAGRLPARRR